MARPGLEVADVLRRFEGEYRRHNGGLSPDQARVAVALTACRTAALGGHVEVCDACGKRQISYNACRDRHCPRCQAAATAAWLERERGYLLPVSYSHVVFTLPHTLAPLALQNPRVCYGLLFQAASQTLLEIAADSRHLGARLGFVAILHTWGQTLLHHPHLHCLVPAGGLSLDERRWIACRRGFFLPVRVLGALFRAKYLALLEKSFQAGTLRFHGRLAALAEPAAFARLLKQVRRQKWVVYAKAPFGGPETVLKYLARYTHRIAISNSRLLSLTDEAVTFRYKDYQHGHVQRQMRLAPWEFLRRFLLHALPQGFVRIRRYGLLANCQREKQLARCRMLLSAEPAAALAPEPHPCEVTSENVDKARAETAEPPRCPACGQGRLRTLERLPPLRGRRRWSRAPPTPRGA
ncbi:MAG: IS91 family transposase [Gemmatimonadota bacterium]|nr:IS91 family transposase [Gemmatimonadota bacterium]